MSDIKVTQKFKKQQQLFYEPTQFGDPDIEKQNLNLKTNSTAYATRNYEDLMKNIKVQEELNFSLDPQIHTTQLMN